ncbi:MAG: hypothetical protein J2O44_04815 [Porphyrobacter sp.]|nr:hypothetical protein [Porphyrobacter sp.]
MIATAGLLAAAPLAAQTEQDRAIYEPQYRMALGDFQKEDTALQAIEKQISQETDLKKGCALLRTDVEHLQKEDTLLNQMEDYSRRMHWERQQKQATTQHAAVSENLKNRQGDIDRLCKNV